MIEANNYDYFEEEKEISKIASNCWECIRETKKCIIPDNVDEKSHNDGIEQIDKLESAIDDLKEISDSLNDALAENQEELENLKYELENGTANYIVGNYAELKRRMEIAGFWKDEMDYFFENLVRYSNKIM